MLRRGAIVGAAEDLMAIFGRGERGDGARSVEVDFDAGTVRVAREVAGRWRAEGEVERASSLD